MSDAIPALTIWQPWATLIMEGCKPFEFRRWQAPRRFWGRRIAIHAGTRKVELREVQDLLHRLDYDGAHGQALDAERSRTLLRGFLRGEVTLPTGSVLGTATLGQPLHPDAVRAKWGNDSDRDAEFQWAWPLSDVQAISPYVPARGAQGFWQWTPPGRLLHG